MKNLLAVVLLFFTVSTYADMEIKQVLRVKNNEFFAITENHGVQHTINRGTNWFARNEGLEQKVVWPFTDSEIRDVISMTYNSANPDLLTLTMAQSLYISTNKGYNWSQVNLKYPIYSSYYLTSSANHPLKKRFFLLGTSCYGLYMSENEGQSWKKVDSIKSHFYHGVDYYQEITSIAILTDGLASEKVFLLSNDGNKIIYSDMNMAQWQVFEHNITDPLYNLSVNKNVLEIYSKNKIYSYDFSIGEWLEAVDLDIVDQKNLSQDKLKRIELASNKKGLYIRWDKATPDKLDDWVALCLEKGFNSVVVDFKNDHGQLTYNSELESAKKFGALNSKIDAKLLIDKFHQSGIYVIARMVVFKDKVLYRAEGNKYATIDKKSGKPWGHLLREEREDGSEYFIQREFWVDPYSDFVWDYNISIAKELESLGIDEIQFDYIRFPSDGNVSLATYRYRKPGMSKIDALESFIRKARNDISVPIGVDLYGFNSFYRLGNWIGQNIELMSKYVDVISPMYYPSHFPRSFVYKSDFFEWAKEIYYHGCNRSAIMTSQHCVIRPYVQAFLLTPAEREMSRVNYVRYLNAQLEGVEESYASGYTLWNNSNIYYMLN
ncbi:MAG: hypothetical protein JXR63_04860 [Spirochaetales bacterium]|nr:hypothetical protein [Spirochaetales bacterium]